MFVLILLTIISKLSTAKSPVPVYLAGYFPITGGNISGDEIMKGAQMATDDVNKNSDVLEGYELRMINRDTKGLAGWGIHALFDLLSEGRSCVMTIGPGNSEVAKAMAKTASTWNMIQILYHSDSPVLSNRLLFPYVFRVVSSNNQLNHVILAVLKYFKWAKVAVIYKDEDHFSLPSKALISSLKDNNITLLDSEGFFESAESSVEMLKKKDTRIIIGRFEQDDVIKVFCTAFKEGLFGARFAWIILGKQLNLEVLTSYTGSECLKEELMEALEKTLYVEFIQENPSPEEVTVSGKTSEQTEKELQVKINNSLHESLTHSKLGYDSVWTAALALNGTYNTTIVNQTIYHEGFSRLLTEKLHKLQFTGITGKVSFTDDGERQMTSVIGQIQKGKKFLWEFYNSLIRRYNGITTEPCSGKRQQNARLFSLIRKLSWKSAISKSLLIKQYGLHQCNKPPVDSQKIFTRLVTIPTSYFLTIACLSFCGILLALLFLAFNVIYRSQRDIKMSSPNLNNCIILGCILAYLSVTLGALDSRVVNPQNFTSFCKAYRWTMCFGFTFAFGAMFSKTWRVFVIFKNPTTQKLVVKDSKLFGMVAIFLFIDVLVLSLWDIIDPVTREVVLLPNSEEQDISSDILYEESVEVCKSTNTSMWITMIYAYKGILLLFGCFLAWETRKVKYAALNDSRFIGMSVYSVVMLSAIAVPLSFIIGQTHFAEAYLVVTICVFFCTTLTLLLVFSPKIMNKFWPGPLSTGHARNGALMLSVAQRDVMTHERHQAMQLDQLVSENANLKSEINKLETRLKFTPLELKLSQCQPGQSSEAMFTPTD